MLLFLWIERTPLPGVPEGIQLFLDYLMSKINKLSSVDQVQNLMNPVCESQIKIYFDCSIECQPALVTPARPHGHRQHVNLLLPIPMCEVWLL